MSRFGLIKLIDITAFALLVLLSSTGMLLHFVLPPRSGHEERIWEMSRHDWGEIHFYIAVTFFVVLVAHLFLHSHFIAKLFKTDSAEKSSLRQALGILGLIVLFSLSIAPFLTG